MKLFGIAAALLLGATAAAQAQQSFDYVNKEMLGVGSAGPTVEGQPVNTATTYLQVRAPLPGVFYPSGAQAYGTEFVRLSDVLAASGAVSGGQLSAALAGIAQRIDRLENRFSEGVALAGSINVLPPNPGDRFAVSLGGAGYNGTGAGSIAISARIREDVIVYGAVARGATQTLVKGGLGISFR